MHRPLVTVLTAALNSVRFLENTILTIRAQTYPHLEHIIVDGASTDGTIELVRRYLGTYNMRFLSEPDGGLYYALNKGLRLASGDILCELDCDDMYLPWSVESAVEALHAHPLVYGDTIGVDVDRSLVSLEGRPGFISSYYRAAVDAISQPAVFWRRQVTERIGLFDTSFKLIADMEYWLRAERNGFKPFKMLEVLAIARRCASSVSHAERNRLLLKLERAKLRATYSHPVFGVLWRLVPVNPIFRRIQIVRFWGGYKRLWPKLRESGAVPTDHGMLLNALGLRACRASATIDWPKVLPAGASVM